MFNSLIHQPCEISLHLVSSDVFIHPPRPTSELPGHDQTLRGLVEVRAPSERTIQGVRVQLQAHQTLAVPEVVGSAGTQTTFTRWEEKVLMDKTVEINKDARQNHGHGYGSHVGGKGKGKAKEGVVAVQTSPQVSGSPTPSPAPAAQSEDMSLEDGIHLDKGVHGFEFAFIIPASSPPFERAKSGRVRYVLTATALGAGRGRSAISTWREIFVILQTNSDGGPTPLDIQYHDVHEALGPLSVSLTSASLTVGGTANLSLYHPDPPPGLSVHVARIFLEQTVELYSEVKKAWTKLPTEKLRVWERGYMPYKDRTKQADPNATPEDALWLRNDEDELHGPGRPARGSLSTSGGVSPFGVSSPSSRSAPTTPGGSELGHGHLQPQPQQPQQQALQNGYKVKSVVRLPDDNTIRPSTVRGSRAEIRVSHDVGVEIFFSRASVLDERENSDSFGKPKVQVFSMRRATVIPSCLCTFDTIHLPPYSFESPANSRPPSPTLEASGFFGGPGATSKKPKGPPGKNATQSEIDHWKLTQTLRAALPHASGSQSVNGHMSSGDNSAARSRAGSREPSPTRHGSSNGNGSNHHHHHHHHHHISFGWPGRKSRNSSPTRQSHPSAEAGNGPSNGAGGGTSTAAGNPAAHPEPIHNRRGSRANIASHLHALTPAHPQSPPSQVPSRPVALSRSNSSYQISSSSNAFPTVVTAPSSGASTPRSLPANSPWAMTNIPHRTPTSHDTCQCGRTTAELVEAESRLLEGAPTAPGAWIDAHDEGQLPPPWTPSRPSSPTANVTGDDAVTWSNAYSNGTHQPPGSTKIGEMLE